VAMGDSPSVILAPINGRDSEGDGRRFIGARHLRREAVDVHVVGEIRGRVRRDVFDSEGLPVGHLRGGTLARLPHRLQPPHRRAERVGQGCVIAARPQIHDRCRIAADKCCQGAVIAITELIQARHRHTLLSASRTSCDAQVSTTR
jgi:hypothetical protein